jgi:uncharacterized protein (TIGR02145 family)
LCEDSHGFVALPGGYSGGSFNYVGVHGYWWSSSETINAYSAYYRYMYYNYETVSWLSSSKSGLYSVRCLQD